MSDKHNDKYFQAKGGQNLRFETLFECLWIRKSCKIWGSIKACDFGFNERCFETHLHIGVKLKELKIKGLKWILTSI